MRFKIAMVNHFPFFCFAFISAKINLRKFIHIRERYERVNTHIVYAKSGWVERKRIAICNFCLFSRSLSFLVLLFRVPYFVAKHKIPKMIIMCNEQWKISIREACLRFYYF